MENSLGRVLVTGATGAVGPALVHALVRRGYTVRVLVRRAPPPALLPAGVEITQGDIDEPQSASAVMDGVAYVCHLAARLHINEPSPQMSVAYLRTNVDATRRLVEAAQEAGVRRFLFFSTINVYGASAPGQIFNEETLANPQSLYAESKLLAEEIVRRAYNQVGEPLSIVLRLAAVYGPHMRGNYRTLAQALRSGRFFYVGSGQNRRTLVFDADVARATIAAAETAHAAGQIFNVTDGGVYTLRQIVETICRVQHSQPPKLHLPNRTMRTLAALCQAGASVVGVPSPITPVLIDKLTEDVAVSSVKLQRELKFSPSVDLQQGWRVTLNGTTGH